jgi:phytoene dehydrogenase-like protein
MNERAIVVGAGIGGLAAAVALARAGRRVTVLEKSSLVGGRGSAQIEEGFVLNQGPHALYPRGAEELERLGLTLPGGSPNKGFTMWLDGRLHPLPSDPIALLANGGLRAGTKWAMTRALVNVLESDPRTWERNTMREWLGSISRDPIVRAFVGAFARVATYTNAPDRVSAGVAIRQVKEGVRVKYVHGGWQVIVDGLLAQAKGVDIRTRTGVRAVEHGARVSGVVLDDGSRIDADEVVLATSPKVALALAGDVAPALGRFVTSATAVRAACLDVALRRLPRRHPSFILDLEQPIYYSVHSLVAELAPKEGGVIHVARYLEPGVEIDPSSVRAELEAVLDRVQPGWRDEIVARHYAPAMTVMHALAEARDGGWNGRPGVDAAGIAGLALVGDWVPKDNLLLDAVLSSAREATEHLARTSVGVIRSNTSALAS